MRIPIKATARVPINRPDTYQRLPKLAPNSLAISSRSHTFGSSAPATPFAIATALPQTADIAGNHITAALIEEPTSRP